MFDTHMHTKFSTDSKMTIDEVISKSKELNAGITITEHMDLMYPDKDKFIFDVDDYFKEYSKYRNDKLLLGIELGMRLDCIDENKCIERNYDFDYVIGSIHIVDNVDIYLKDFYENRTIEDSYTHYFTYMLDCLKRYDFIDSLGHIDYIARYAPFEDREVYYEQYKELLDEILKFAASTGKALEINTRRLSDKNAFNNLKVIYKRFRELGGKIVTIGSDAHNKEGIASNFNSALEIASAADLRPVYFKNRKPEFIY